MRMEKLRVKTRAFCTVLLLTLPLMALADETVVDGGFLAGMNTSGVSSRFNEYDNLLGGQGGFWLKIGKKWFQVETGLEYSYRANKFEQISEVGVLGDPSTLQTQKYSVRSSSHHITFPLSIAFGFWPNNDCGESRDGDFIGVSVSGGGYVDVGVAGTIKAKGSCVFQPYGSTQSDMQLGPVSTGLYGSDSYQQKRFDYGWQVGLIFGVGTVFRIGATYRHGLANLSNLPDYKITNRCLMVNIMFSFFADN